MSSIIQIARHIMAVMQPQTGNRATGTATVTATGDDVLLPRSSYALPVIGRQVRADLIFKVGEGPNSDGSWTVTSGGTAVDFLSNIGGARHNLADATSMIFDPPVSGIASIVTSGAFSGGADPTILGGIKDMVSYEQFDDGPSRAMELFHGMVKAFPVVVVAWHNSEPADGSVTSTTSRRSRTGRTAQLYQETYSISVITSRAESDHIRKLEGLSALHDLTLLLTDRQSVDGIPFSNPAGIQIKSRGRQSGPQKIYQQFYIYNLLVAVTHAIHQTDARTYNDLETVMLDVFKPQDPELPDQGDYTIVDDNEIDMTEE